MLLIRVYISFNYSLAKFRSSEYSNDDGEPNCEVNSELKYFFGGFSVLNGFLLNLVAI